MKKLMCALPVMAVLLAAQSQAAPADTLPKKVGTCVFTKIKSVETRLGYEGKPVAGSGSAVSFINGGYQVAYDQVPGVDTSKAGDKVMMCLLSLPSNCPAGDNRGKVYTTTNLRTSQSWTLSDSEHNCGGA